MIVNSTNDCKKSDMLDLMIHTTKSEFLYTSHGSAAIANQPRTIYRTTVLFFLTNHISLLYPYSKRKLCTSSEIHTKQLSLQQEISYLHQTNKIQRNFYGAITKVNTTNLRTHGHSFWILNC